MSVCNLGHLALESLEYYIVEFTFNISFNCYYVIIIFSVRAVQAKKRRAKGKPVRKPEASSKTKEKRFVVHSLCVMNSTA